MELLETFGKSLEGISIAGLPAYKLLIAFGILLLTLMLQGFITGVIIKWIESLAAGTESDLDDQLIAVIKKPLSWLVLIGGLWIIQTFLAVDLKQIELKETTSSLLELATIALVAYTVYTAAPILGKVLEALTLHTDTDLDDLLVPYLPRLFRIAAVVVLLITAADILFGQSAGALIGLLGGAGVALGLLFKDIIYDWCCAVIIYTDRLYKPKDWVVVSGLSGFFQIAEIGLRTTKLYSWEWGSIIKMPNSKMVSGIIDNWSQNRAEDDEWGFTGTVNLDCITADQVETIMTGLNEMFENIDGFIYHYVWFRGVEGNTRIIKYVSYITPNSYGSATKAFHLGAMRLLDKEGIAANSVYIIADEDAYTNKLKMVKKDSN